MKHFNICEALFVKARTKTGRYLSMKEMQKMLTFREIHLCKIREYHYFCVENYGRLQYIKSNKDIEWSLECANSLCDSGSRLSQTFGPTNEQKIELLLMIDFG